MKSKVHEIGTWVNILCLKKRRFSEPLLNSYRFFFRKILYLSSVQIKQLWYNNQYFGAGTAMIRIQFVEPEPQRQAAPVSTLLFTT
jgi:hypothetical protein